MVSVVLLLVLILAISVILTYPMHQQNDLQSQVVTDQKSKMDKFKSGTYKPAKEIGY
jgi:lipopolysaccharide export system protein LptC